MGKFTRRKTRSLVKLVALVGVTLWGARRLLTTTSLLVAENGGGDEGGQPSHRSWGLAPILPLHNEKVRIPGWRLTLRHRLQ